jgi:transcription antitermination factor NusG
MMTMTTTTTTNIGLEWAPPNDDSWPGTAAGTWYVLRTRSRQEKILANGLRARGVGHYLPLVTCTKMYGGRRAKIELPLFPGYLFVHGEPADAFEADRSGRVAQIIPVVDQLRFDRELRSIFLALEVDATLDPYPYLANGVRVEVTDGPLRGVRGIVAERTRTTRLILQIEMLGQAVAVEIDGASLSLVD